MPTEAYGDEVAAVLQLARERAQQPQEKLVKVDGQNRGVHTPFPSPGDWRDCWIYFLMIDRFANPQAPPNSTLARPSVAWDEKYGFRQGGTFKGVQGRLGYLEELGVKALWLSPVLKNSAPADWEYNYHGYGAQDFLNIDERFASDGTRETAERELTELIDEAHARGIYVVLDIVLNHAGRVFDYVQGPHVVASFEDPALLAAAPGAEPAIQWLDGSGKARADWQDRLSGALGPDDAVWPSELQRVEFFRRKGNKLSDEPEEFDYVPGDFGVMRQLALEYEAKGQDQAALEAHLGNQPVLAVLIRCYEHLIAKYDIDGFRIDTVKYVEPAVTVLFGDAMRDFARGIGKTNFFTFAEIYDGEEMIDRFIGQCVDGPPAVGIDAALDFPLFFQLPAVIKRLTGVEAVRRVFTHRYEILRNQVGSHEDLGGYFVTFLDNHDQSQRINHEGTPQNQVAQALALMFTLPGIPCLYYGTEQGLQGTRNPDGGYELDAPESVREALWGKPNAFDVEQSHYTTIQALARLQLLEPSLRSGQLYFRELSGDGQNFGHSMGPGGLLAFSRILANRECVVVANTSTDSEFSGFVLVQSDDAGANAMTIAFSNFGTGGEVEVELVPDAQFYVDGRATGGGPVSSIAIHIAPGEVQIWVPV
jgi:glycosidase